MRKFQDVAWALFVGAVTVGTWRFLYFKGTKMPHFTHPYDEFFWASFLSLIVMAIAIGLWLCLRHPYSAISYVESWGGEIWLTAEGDEKGESRMISVGENKFPDQCVITMITLPRKAVSLKSVTRISTRGEELLSIKGCETRNRKSYCIVLDSPIHPVLGTHVDIVVLEKVDGVGSMEYRYGLYWQGDEHLQIRDVRESGPMVKGSV